MDDENIHALAEKYGKDESQIILRWMMQHENLIAIPKSSSTEHIQSNFDIWDFELSDEDMAIVSNLRIANDRHVDPSWAPEWDVAA